MRLFIFSCLMIGLIHNCLGQSLNQYKTEITNSLNKEDFYEAYSLIEQALQYDTEVDSFHMLAGMAAFNLNAFSRATKHFKIIVDRSIIERHPEIEFYLAESQYYQGFYSDALIYYKSYLATTVQEGHMYDLGKKRIDAVMWAKENLAKKDPLIQIKRLDEQVNTKENEFAPFLMDSFLYITSQNTFEKTKKGKIAKNSGKIIKLRETTMEPLPDDKVLFEEDLMLGHACFNQAGTKLFFTVCNYEESKTTLKCDIYSKIKTSKGWGPKIKMQEPVNKPNYSSSQPFITKDPSTQLDKLYFASNRPGGKGGYVIYSVLLNDNHQPSPSENVEFINTEENEFSPFYNTSENTLYFSSKGHKGFGGLDVFSYAFKGKMAGQIINLGPSVNSSYDDLYYSEDLKKRKGYLVSNRPTSFYVDEEVQACCYDIYKIKYVPATVELTVNTYDKYDSTPLGKVTLIVKDITDLDTSYLTTPTPDEPAQKFKITEDRKYRITANKPNWIGDTVFCSAIDLENFDPIVKNLYLTEIKSLEALTFERTTNVPLKGVTIELWDMDHNKLIKTTTKLDSNFFDFTILKGTNYKLSAKKNKYESAMVLITPLETSKESILRRNLYLELTAIAELRKLLPIRLFFENDMPDIRSQSDSTSVGFLDIYNEYYNKKSKYIYEFTNKMRGSSKDRSILEIDTFFERNVKANAEKLKLFMDKLIIILEEGHEIDIFLKGFASPRAKSDYNQHLSSRRVYSVRNEFDRYSNKVFHDYIVNRNFKIKEIPFGESLSSNDVSDKLEDTRNSIYSLKAAYERRLEILEILKGVEENGKL